MNNYLHKVVTLKYSKRTHRMIWRDTNRYKWTGAQVKERIKLARYTSGCEMVIVDQSWVNIWTR